RDQIRPASHAAAEASAAAKRQLVQERGDKSMAACKRDGAVIVLGAAERVEETRTILAWKVEGNGAAHIRELTGDGIRSVERQPLRKSARDLGLQPVVVRMGAIVA